jgi:uncharacterized protein (TIGR02246 family)
MSRRLCSASGLLCALALAACATRVSSVSEGSLATEEQTIRDLDRQWVAAVAAKDVERTRAFYAPDAVFMAPNAPTASGDALRAAWAQMLGMPNLALTFSPTQVRVSGDGTMAYDVGTYSFAFDGPHGRVQDQGKYLVVWRKVGGQWKAAADMFNTNAPMPQ